MSEKMTLKKKHENILKMLNSMNVRATQLTRLISAAAAHGHFHAEDVQAFNEELFQMQAFMAQITRFHNEQLKGMTVETAQNPEIVQSIDGNASASDPTSGDDLSLGTQVQKEILLSILSPQVSPRFGIGPLQAATGEDGQEDNKSSVKLAVVTDTTLSAWLEQADAQDDTLTSQEAIFLATQKTADTLVLRMPKGSSYFAMRFDVQQVDDASFFLVNVSPQKALVDVRTMTVSMVSYFLGKFAESLKSYIQKSEAR